MYNSDDVTPLNLLPKSSSVFNTFIVHIKKHAIMICTISLSRIAFNYNAVREELNNLIKVFPHSVWLI